MKKILTPCLIACALTVSTNSFGMLLRNTPRIKPPMAQKHYCQKQFNFSSDLSPKSQAEYFDQVKIYTNIINNRAIRNEKFSGFCLSQNSQIDDLSKRLEKHPDDFVFDDLLAIYRLIHSIEDLEICIRNSIIE